MGKMGAPRRWKTAALLTWELASTLLTATTNGFAGGAEEAGEFFVERREAGLAIDDENEQGSFFDGDICLAQDFGRDEGFVVGDDAAGVDDFHFVAEPFGFAVDAVAGDAGLVGDDGAARAGQAIEERGLADVGAADDDERWKFFL